MLYLATLLISLIITIAIMPYSRQLAVRLQAMDKPNHRKVHKDVMPKCGGIAMAAGACVPLLLWAPRSYFIKGFFLGALIIVIFGVADDIKDLKPNLKLLGQVMAALIITLVSGIKITDLGSLWVSGATLPTWVSIPLTVLVIVGVTNATNLSDGLDGLAGGASLLILLCIGYLSVGVNDSTTLLIAIAIGGSVLGFLRFNSYPAQLFMGDAGSQLLGFSSVVLALRLAQQSPTISAILPLIIFGIPILDTLTVMVRRLMAARSPFSADRTHFHHQLMAIGLYHSEAVLSIYALQSLFILFAIACHGANDWILLFVYLLTSCTLLGIFFHLKKAEYQINRAVFLKPIKARLKPIKDRGQIIKVTFSIVKIGMPALLLFNALFTKSTNKFDLIFSATFLFFLLLAWYLNKKYLDRLSRIAFYLFTPFLVFNCDQGLYSTFDAPVILIYNGLYLVLLASVLLTMKLTRRSNGFKSSTLDFLVIFVIILIPNIPNTTLKDYLLGLVAIKTVILYYSFEVLIGELRRKSVSFTISAAIFIVTARGLSIIY